MKVDTAPKFSTKRLVFHPDMVTRTEKVRLPWAQLYRKERIMAAARLTGYTALAGGVLAAANWMMGSSPRILDREERIERGKAVATARYERMQAPIDRYQAAYITPFEIKVKAKEGGERIRRWYASPKDTVLIVGQSCLKGTPLDTRRLADDRTETREVDDIAYTRTEGGQFKVYAPGTEVAALVFDQRGIPTTDTRDTLIGYGCIPGPELTVTAQDVRGDSEQGKPTTFSLPIE